MIRLMSEITDEVILPPVSWQHQVQMRHYLYGIDKWWWGWLAKTAVCEMCKILLQNSKQNCAGTSLKSGNKKET